MKRKKRLFTTTRIIALGFLAAILIGTVLLSLPAASANGQPTPLLDALFTATSSTCVTGLTTVVTAEHWSLFGQAVILLLVQFGGLGIVTVTTTVLLLLGRRISLKDRLLIQEAYNLDTLQGLVRITIRIVRGALAVEAGGALLYSLQFVPEFGFLRGVWYSVFHSVSAFCNAGLDLIGSDSLVCYRGNVLVNTVTMLLIILGGIGFPVWWNILDNLRELRRRHRRNEPGKFLPSAHTKLALTATAVLIIGGALLVFVMEYGNPATLGELPLGEKLMASLFQSVTLRTAGFQTIPQQSFRDGTCMVFLVLMIIGGSPSGTAGGIKTVTAALILASVAATVRGEETGLMKRRFSDRLVKKAVAVFGVSVAALFVLTTLLLAVQSSDFLDTLYEMTSAMATVGLSRNFTGSLSEPGRLIVILGMYLGRIGPITMALAINVKHSGRKLSYPEGRALVG